MENAHVTIDGWLTDEPTLFQKLIENPPPRPITFWYQICQDAKSWIVWCLWCVIIASIVAAILMQWYLLVVPGLILLYKYSLLLRMTVSNFRKSPITAASIEAAVCPHPLGNVVTGKPQMTVAETPDGRTIPLTISESLVKAAFSTSEKAEVLFLDNPSDDFPLALAVRPTVGIATKADEQKEAAQ